MARARRAAIEAPAKIVPINGVSTTTQESVVTVELSPDVLLDNPWQSRSRLDPAKVEERAASIAEIGLLTHPLARPSPTQPGRYELAHGHIRRAAIALLIQRGQWQGGIPVDVRDLSDRDMALIGWAENLQRVDVSVTDQLRSYKGALETIPGLTIEAIAQKVGVDRSTLSNGLRVLRLPSVVLDRVDSGELPLHGAREFLCLVGQDHAHQDIMEGIIREIATTREESGGPNWRVKNIRRLVQGRVLDSKVTEWRRLAAGPGFSGTSHVTDPRFDVEAFVTAHAEHVHNIPWDDGSLVWTCNVKAWQAAQSAAPQPETLPLDQGGDPDRTGPRRENSAAVLRKVLAKDPVAKQLVAALETVEAKAALGTRGELVDLLRHKGFVANFDAQKYETGAVPPYFSDEAAQCRAGCITGYVYAVGYDARPKACCTNKDCYQKKLQVARRVYQDKAEAQLAQEAVEDQTTAQDLAQSLSMEAGQKIARALLLATRLLATRFEYDPRFGEEFRYVPEAVAKVNKLLGVPKSDNYYETVARCPALKALEKADGDTCRAVAGWLVVYILRYASSYITV